MTHTKIQPYFNTQTKTLYINTVHNNDIVLKVNEDLKNSDVNIYMTPVTKKEHDILVFYCQGKKIDEAEIENIKVMFPHINIDNILMYGNGNERYTSYGRFSSLFQQEERRRMTGYGQRNQNIGELSFRSYEKSYEDWHESAAHTNLCTDMKMCWQSAIRKLGGKEIHGLDNDYIDFFVILWYNILSLDEIRTIHGL